MDEHDDVLARLYRRSSREEPRSQLDLAVLELARRSVRRRAWSPFGGNWPVTGAVTAVALVSVVLVVLMREQPASTALPAPGTAGSVPPVSDAAGERSLEAGRIRLALPPAGLQSKAVATDPVAGTKREGGQAAGAGAAASTAQNAAEAVAEDRASGPPQPRFDFYKSLPEMQVEVPAAEVAAATQAARVAAPPPAAASAGAVVPALRDAPGAPSLPAEPAPGQPVVAPAAPSAAAARPVDGPSAAAAAASASAPAGYYLQVGAFRAADYAQRFKTRLERLKLPASIEAIRLANGETWHRVRVGPYPDPAAVLAAQARLKAEGIDSMQVRVDEPG